MTRRFWLLPALLAVIVALLGVAMLYDLGGPQERALMKAVSLREGHDDGPLIIAMQWITWVGDAAQRSVLMIGFAGWLWLVRKRWRAALIMVVAVSLSGVTSSLLKEAFSRPRPSVVPHLDLVTSFSYPSGHAVGAMALWLLAALLLARRGRGLWIALAVGGALLIGASRTILGVHYPSDVVGGWLLGAAFALTGWGIARRLEASAPARVEPSVQSLERSHPPLDYSGELHPPAAAPDAPPPRA